MTKIQYGKNFIIELHKMISIKMMDIDPDVSSIDIMNATLELLKENIICLYDNRLAMQIEHFKDKYILSELLSTKTIDGLEVTIISKIYRYAYNDLKTKFDCITDDEYNMLMEGKIKKEIIENIKDYMNPSDAKNFEFL